MNEGQKNWALRAKKLLLHLEMREALPGKHAPSLAELEQEIAAVEDLILSYRVLFANVSLCIPGDVSLRSSPVLEGEDVRQTSHCPPHFTGSTSDWRQSDSIH
jgi:hypothetical protein